MTNKDNASEIIDMVRAHCAEVYQRGLEDAWECARKIFNDIPEKDTLTMFHEDSFRLVFQNHTAQDAIAKIKDYESTINYHDDFATALEKMHKYEERQTVSAYDKRCSNCKHFELYHDNYTKEECQNCTDHSEWEKQTENSCENCFFYGHCKYYGKTMTWLLGDKNEQTGEKVCRSWKPNK